MKLKIIKDNEVVVDGKEYKKLLCFEKAFKSMQRKICAIQMNNYHQLMNNKR